MNEYGQVDDKPYGGGEGMVLMAEPLERSIKSISSDKRGNIVNLSPQGERFSQSKAQKLSKLDNLTIIAGRYEGIDERIINQYVDEEISIGDFVLSGGEFAALTLIDVCARFIPGVMTPGINLAHTSMSVNAANSPPLKTKSPIEISSSTY